jgi:6-pyruvoyltetrahydropterin/6-carboxytetrahydropterin synthase
MQIRGRSESEGFGYDEAMQFEISSTREFSAAHALKVYDGSMEPLHGHNWRVRVTVGAKKLDSIGVVMDFHELERLVDAIIGPWHNHNLNEAPSLKKLNPSAENVAVVIGRGLRLPYGVKLASVEVWETESNRAVVHFG